MLRSSTPFITSTFLKSGRKPWSTLVFASSTNSPLTSSFSALNLPHFTRRREEDEVAGDDFHNKFRGIAKRHIHTSPKSQSVSLALACVGGAGVLYGTSILVERYQQQAKEAATANGEAKPGETPPPQASAANFFGTFFTTYGKGYYEGGFEEVMTKREAALILGVRESASREKVREAHRRMAMINHPDTGGE